MELGSYPYPRRLCVVRRSWVMYQIAGLSIRTLGEEARSRRTGPNRPNENQAMPRSSMTRLASNRAK